jgi:hypothetical protein
VRTTRTYRRPTRVYYGTINYHRPARYRSYVWRSYRHSIYRHNYYHTIRYYSYADYYRFVFNSYRRYVYVHWIYWPISYSNGYYVVDGYPYYVYNGYRHRYSTFDRCSYQLFDKYTHRVERNFWANDYYSCKDSYDACARLRDDLNYYERDFRYSCAETYRDRNFDFRTYSYEYDDYYSGYDDDYYDDDYEDYYDNY